MPRLHLLPSCTALVLLAGCAATPLRIPDPIALPARTDAAADAAGRTAAWLFDRQAIDGHWRAPLEGDTILESEYLLLLAWAGRTADPHAPGACARHKRVQKMMNPMNVPVANVLNDAWNEYPEYADPNNRPAPRKGPKDFYIKSSREDGRLKTR